MLKIAIVDDDIHTINELYHMIEETGKTHNITFATEDFCSGDALLEHMQKTQIRYDLIFLDIEMGKMNGIDTAREIRKLDELVYLIYVTNYESFALEAYEVYPYQFLLKPVSFHIVEKNLMKIYARLTSENFYYEYTFKKNYYKILMNDILYFESNRRVIHIHLINGNVCIYYDKLNMIEEKISHTQAVFWRIHQSLLVNAKYVIRKSYDQIELSNGEILYISEDRRKNVNAQFVKLVEDEFHGS